MYSIQNCMQSDVTQVIAETEFATNNSNVLIFLNRLRLVIK
jgi:hypothetical protein